MISYRKQRLKYIFGDYVASNVAWCVFSCIRYIISAKMMSSQGYSSLSQFLLSDNVLFGQIVLPICVLGVFYLSGYYNNVFRKSRLQELITTFLSTLVCTLLIFFAVLVNDTVSERMFNYEMLLCLWGTLFGVVYCVRYIITRDATLKIHNRKWVFKTLVIGNGKEAHQFVEKLNKMKKSLGYDVLGFVNIPGEMSWDTGSSVAYELNEVSAKCKELGISEILIIPSKNNIRSILHAVNVLFSLGLPIKILPSMFHILVSNVKLSSISGEPLVDVAVSNMSESASNIKRCGDVLISIIAIVLLTPFMLVLALLIKRDSSGSVIYKQERIGKRNIPFNIYKFRTMCKDAENSGIPMLSTENDGRITPLGRYMRKYRLDEIPQFWNVLKGDMSIVGPRPERRYFIDKIMKKAPYYALVHQVRPGITSLGMVKYGYATNVDEMIERLRYDLIYIENMSIINDMKIMIYTIKTVITGRGM